MVTDPLLGVALALLAALGWAGQYLCIRVGTDEGSVREAMVVALLVNVALVVPAVVAWYYPDYGVTPVSLAAFAAAGVAGSWLSRELQFRSTELVGAARTAPVVSANALVAAALAIALLGETATALHLIGVVLIVGAVAVVSRETADDDVDDYARRDVLVPVAAAALLGVEPILLKWGFAAGTPTAVGLAVMLGTATVGYLASERLRGRLDVAAALSAGERRWYVGAGVAGTAALVGYFAALATAPVVVVVPVLQTAPLLVVGLSVVFLPRRLERVTPRLAGATVVVAVGTVLVSLA